MAAWTHPCSTNCRRLLHHETKSLHLDDRMKNQQQQTLLKTCVQQTKDLEKKKKKKKMRAIKQYASKTDSNFLRPILHLPSWNSLGLMGNTNSTTFGVLKLGTLHGNQYFYQCLVRAQPFAGTCRYLAGLFTFCGRPLTVDQLRTSGRNGSEQSSLWKNVLCGIMLSCEMWSVLHANEWQESSNVGGNWCRQWTTSDLVQWCHPP